MRDVTVRRADIDDAAAILAVFHRARAQAMPWLPVVHTAAEDAQWVVNTVLTEWTTFVGEVDGAVRGYAGMTDGWLCHLFVDPQWHGRGVGTALLAEVRRRTPELQLWVFQRNERARAFYERRGFVLVEQTDGGGNEEREPDARYRWPAVPASLEPSGS